MFVVDDVIWFDSSCFVFKLLQLFEIIGSVVLSSSVDEIEDRVSCWLLLAPLYLEIREKIT